MYRMGHGFSNICDSSGNIKLISNGCNILSPNKNIFDGCDSIGGRAYINHYYGVSSGSQASLFIPLADNVYYLIVGSASEVEFSQWGGSHDAVFDLLLYNKIDMNGNGGLGKVVSREVPILQNVTLSKTQIMACKHANGVDWWLLKQYRGANKVHKFLFTKDSVFDEGTQSFSEPTFSWYDQSGQSKFSEDGTKYATTCRGTGKIFLADFNRCTGNLSSPKVYNIPEQYNALDTTAKETFTQGLSFSPNGRFLYISMYFNIMQLDLLDNDSATAWYHVAGLDTTINAFQLYSDVALGPDNKLYFGNYSGLSKQMSIVENPNIKGVGCNFCPRCLRMPKQGVTDPPCMPNYELGADSSICWSVGVHEVVKQKEEWVVYPNPTSSKIYIKNAKYQSKKELYNSVGQLMLATKENEIDVSRFAKGMYYIRCDGMSKKVIKE